MDTNWRPDLAAHPGPKYLALLRALREAIRDGVLPQGVQLPTVRELGWQLGVTPGTVSRAYQMATQEGLLAATVGRGTFVAAQSPRLGPTQSLFVEIETEARGLIDLRSPQLPDVGQARVLAEAMARAGARASGWRPYPSQRGEAGLRKLVCDWLADSRLGEVAPDDLALTHGGQNALLLVMLCCLRGDRPVVLCEDLAYPGIRHAARLARADVVGVEMDHEGILPEALEAACRRHGAQVLVLTPDAQNPTAASMGTARRAEVIRIARAFDLQVIEDHCYAPSRCDQPALRQLGPERCWYVGSLSKSISAALRFGYVVCPRGMGEAGRLTAQHGSFALGAPVSATVEDLLQSGAAAELARAVQVGLDQRLQVMAKGLAGFDTAFTAGVPFVWLHLPQGWRGSTFTRAAEAAGVLLRPADEYALIHGRAPHAVRVAACGGVETGRLADAVAVLARLLTHPPSDMAV